MLRGNNRHPCHIADIEKSSPGTAYALWPRKVRDEGVYRGLQELHPSTDYGDVHRSWCGPARHEVTGHASLYNGKTNSFCVVSGPGCAAPLPD
eukprot:52819-Prorocentrum_minimum.AAC.1